MATAAKKKTSRGLKQDGALVAGTQQHEVAYEAKKTGATTGAVKKAVKTAGNPRQAVEVELKKRKA